MCASVARATIDFVVEEGLVERTKELGNYFRAGLEALQKNFSIIGNISGLGLNLAVDLVKDQVTKERAKTEAEELMIYCMEHGISFKLIQGNILNLKPSLIVTKEEIDHVLETLEKGFSLLQSKII